MKSCTTQAEQLVTQIKTERTARVQKYKANMEKNKADIKNMVSKVFGDYSQMGSALAGMNLGAGFNFPAPDLNITGEYMDKFRNATQNSPDGALLLEDPDKYVELMKKNVTKMKDAFTQMQTQLTGRGGTLAQHIEQTKRNYQVAQQKAEAASRECIGKHDDYIRQSEQQRQQQLAEQTKKQNELGEKRQQVCALYSVGQTNPTAPCQQSITDMMASDPDAVGRLGAYCRTSGNAPRDEGNDASRAARICARLSTITDTTLKATVTEMCARARNVCPTNPSTTTAAPSTNTPASATPASPCTSNPTFVYGEIIAAVDTADPSNTETTFPDAPAYCNAGNNSDRYDGNSDLSFLQQLAQTAAGGQVNPNP